MNPKYYKDGAIKPDLVTTDAERVAKSFIPNGVPELKAAQLRKFYGEVKNLELRLKSSADKKATFRQILPLIKLLKAKGAYACKRKVVPDAFKTWLTTNVDAVEDIKDFEAFLLYFEAVVGFCYGEAKDNYN